jgi:multidrug resistance efflux pump
MRFVTLSASAEGAAVIREPNSQRKALRVSIPLYVEIDGSSHVARDWSTLGLGVEGLARTPALGEVVPARISFPMQESMLVLPVELVFRGLHDGVAGFDFHALSARNRRVLRHYVELSLDGRLGDVDDMVALAASAPVHTPVDHPLNLPAAVEPATLGGYRARGWGAMLLGVAALAVAAGVIFYNVAWKVEGTGFVAGSIARVTANHDGQLARLLVQPGAQVEPNAPLFAVENTQLRNEIAALETQVAQLASAQSHLDGARQRAQAALLAQMQRDWAARNTEVQNARKLFEGGAITQRDLLLVSSQADELRQSYLREMAEGTARSQGLAFADTLAKLKLDLAARKALLARQESEGTVRAPVRGKVFRVDKQQGEFVAARDPVLLLETDTTPSVLLRLPNDDALKLQPGMPATVYVPYEDRKYAATVGAVGLAAANAAVPETQEGGLGETLVRLEFNDRRVRLPANARVNVWIRSLWPSIT